MISLIDFILNLFRDQNAAADYIAHPEQALLDAGLGNVAPAQIAAVAATAVPSVALGQGDPVLGLQRAVSNQWGFEPVYAPQRVFAPETNTDLLKVRVIVELIDHTRKIAETNRRDDLVERLEKARERIGDPQIRVVIAGQLKQGKSQLLNSLLNMPVARVGDDESTVLTTVVLYSEQPAARLVVATPDGASS